VIATVSTTPKTAEASSPARFIAAAMKAVAVMPESTFIRTGVPSRGWKTPRARLKNPPSAAAIACIRSLTIIQALPWVTSANANSTAVAVSSGPLRSP
jgi:hypothetical protein